ncbi:hypothetical protein [Corynebacterium capitovis]|nr:hypothetical protein [Corynebacterium capitovis]
MSDSTHDPGIRDELKGRRGTFHSDEEKQFRNVDGYENAVAAGITTRC